MGRIITIAALSGLALASPATAKVTAISIRSAEPFAAGASFGQAGAYERVVGTIEGELDPADPRNAGIVDLALAPRNAAGRVAYQTDFFMLRPKDPAKGSGTLLYEVVNRGRKFLFNWVLDAEPQSNQAVNDPKDLKDAGDGLVLRRGDTIVWTGWEADAPRQGAGMAIDVPVAVQRDGTAIVTKVRDELVSGTRGPATDLLPLTFAAASTDANLAQLTVRRREAETPVPIPASGWTYADTRHIRLLPDGTKPEPGSLYELVYDVSGPKVLGIGFAATRDAVAFLRSGAADTTGAANPAGTSIHHAVALGISQSGRFLRDFIHQGFNQDESGHRVFDGMLAHISGVGGVFLNARFGQPSRTNTEHEDHLYPENAFPFSAAEMLDPGTGTTGALLRHDGFDPLLMEVNTSTEYWQKGASMLTTDPLGQHDVDLPTTERAYLISSGFHYGRHGLTSSKGACANPRNTLSPAPALRALLVDLEDWVSEGREPPPSRVPRISDGSLVPPNKTGFPVLPGLMRASAPNAIARFGNYVEPQAEPGPQYRPLVPRADADGNDLAGVRLPEVAVPLATRTGWNLYDAPFPTGELCDREGSLLPLARTQAERDANGDPRLSIAERYPTDDAYVTRMQKATDDLVKARLLLPEDAADYLRAAHEGLELPQ